jgi:hypothetical protein
MAGRAVELVHGRHGWTYKEIDGRIDVVASWVAIEFGPLARHRRVSFLTNRRNRRLVGFELMVKKNMRDRRTSCWLSYFRSALPPLEVCHVACPGCMAHGSTELRYYVGSRDGS